MIYYMIRHKVSGEYMPQMKRGRGYSHWNPSTNTRPDLALDVPRLIGTRRRAAKSIAEWSKGIATRFLSQGGMYGEDLDEVVDTKPDGRSSSDLEIVEVDILEIEI